MVLAELHDERLPLPVTLLNGRLLCSGALDPLRVVTSIADRLARDQEAER